MELPAEVCMNLAFSPRYYSVVLEYYFVGSTFRHFPSLSDFQQLDLEKMYEAVTCTVIELVPGEIERHAGWWYTVRYFFLSRVANC